MGFKFASFGAATVPLSKIVADKDFDMGRYSIKAQYRPEEWATETLEWGDTAPSDYSPEVNFTASSGGTDYELFTNTGPGAKYRVKVRVPSGTWDLNYVAIKVDGVTAATRSGVANGTTYESPAFGVETGQTVVVTARSGATGTITYLSYQCTGEVFGAKTFDLTGKWLALGIDMHGLDATVKIHGVEVPYSDYAKYFPLVPTELKFPSGWTPSQERPVIKVYKGL